LPQPSERASLSHFEQALAELLVEDAALDRNGVPRARGADKRLDQALFALGLVDPKLARCAPGWPKLMLEQLATFIAHPNVALATWIDASVTNLVSPTIAVAGFVPTTTLGRRTPSVDSDLTY
jgi:hypothetical protein